MKSGVSKVIVICGQTATGKSALAVELAKKFGGEIISADSRQIYKGLDIGTDKISPKEMLGIRHYLISFLDPKKDFSAAEFKKLAEQKIKKIIKRGKMPIIVGGTGFYLDTIVHGNAYPAVPPNLALRAKLAKLSPARLLAMLEKIDPERAATIEIQNPRRLIRAIEIAKDLGKVPLTMTEAIPPQKVLKIGLTLPSEMLKAKIRYRLLKNLENGLLKETRCLRRWGLSWRRLESFGLYYRFAALFLQKKISYAQMIDGATSSIWQYARRQMTWFKRDPEIKWFNSNEETGRKKIYGAVKKFLIR